MDTFDRYREANEVVENFPDVPDKPHLREAAQQLLHIEQSRKVAEDTFHEYQRHMNEWENNILNEIKRDAQKVAGDLDGK